MITIDDTNVPTAYRAFGRMLRDAGTSPGQFAEMSGGTDDQKLDAYRISSFALEFFGNGAPTFALHVKGLSAIARLIAFDRRDPPTSGLQLHNFLNEERASRSTEAARHLVFDMRRATRIAANAVAFVTTYRASVERREGTPADVRVLDVACPRELHVDRFFRDQVKELVAARTIPRARGVLEHFVRGHWRESEEDLIWIAPYRRGDSNIGRVVSRVERLT